MGANDLTEDERRQFAARVADLHIEHRDLDAAIAAIELKSEHDQLQVRRLKKRKLLLKDEIAWIERMLDPDERA